MSLDGLPEELLILIFRQLDLNAIRNVYDTGNHRLRDIISSQKTVKKAQLGLSSLATAHTLKIDFFKAISMNLQELDLSAVPDLTKSILLPAVKKMINLVTLNVAYTNITIFDLIKIYEVCSTIKNVTVNFQFHKPNLEPNLELKSFLPDLDKCQDLFSNFENVHFVGSVKNLFYSCLPLHILHKAKLNTVTYTIGLNDKMFTVDNNAENKAFYCNKFTLIMHDEEFHFRSLARMEESFPNPIKNAPFEYEYVHFFDGAFYISPAFCKHFKENYKNRSVYIEPLEPFRTVSDLHISKSNSCLIIWNKETTNFNETFFRELDYELKKLDSCLIHYDAEIQPVVISHDWVRVVHPWYFTKSKKDENLIEFKRRRVSSPNITIDYDNILKDKRYVELTICFEHHVFCAVTLSSTSNFLKNLTFLQLRGAVRYSREFFNILFRCCENLITLDVEGYPISPCAPPISRSLPLSRSIKNLRIVEKTIDLQTLFSSLGQSVRLENIQIVNASIVISDIPSGDTLFKQCDNLYYLSVCGTMSDAARTKNLTMLNKAKLKYNRHHLFIEIFNKPDSQYIYDPFVNVFKLKRKIMWDGMMNFFKT